MASKRITVGKLTRLEARTRVIQGAGRMAMISFCLSLGFVVVAAAFPQMREVERLEEKLEAARKMEDQALFERDCREIELRALREDSEFLELHARDRLNYSRPGERVLRFRRSE